MKALAVWMMPDEPALGRPHLYQFIVLQVRQAKQRNSRKGQVAGNSNIDRGTSYNTGRRRRYTRWIFYSLFDSSISPPHSLSLSLSVATCLLMSAVSQSNHLIYFSCVTPSTSIHILTTKSHTNPYLSRRSFFRPQIV